jgi:hypothetical protein
VVDGALAPGAGDAHALLAVRVVHELGHDDDARDLNLSVGFIREKRSLSDRGSRGDL